ncbi:MAG TPA: hypothetical protein VHS05_11350 [Pyrinomonadaceae bacterium]|nr:hypothetical protein [Pyrinomonadaceae bacterium]
MKRREQWRPVLDAELKRWRAKSSEQLLAELRDQQAYEIEFENKMYQVEVEILENTEKYVHVLVAVDDGTLPAALLPLSSSFIREK